MRRRELRFLPGSSRRAAYTLLELTVVIFIIVTLMALSAGAVIKFMAVQQGSNTKLVLDRTQAKLNKAWSAVKDQALKEPIPAIVQTQIMASLAGNDANAQARMRVIYVKLRLRQVFPMNFCEAMNVPYVDQTSTDPQLLGLPIPQSPLLALPAYQTYLSNLGITPAYLTSPAYTPQPYESSACLMMALQRFQSGSGVDTSDLTGGGATGNATTPNGGSLPYLTDAWNEPIIFTRAPTGSLFLNPNGPQVGNNDPGDPQGYLNSAVWSNNVSAQTMFKALTQQTFTPLSLTPSSFKLAPMLMSKGPDKAPAADPVTFAPLSTANGYVDDLFSTP